MNSTDILNIIKKYSLVSENDLNSYSLEKEDDCDVNRVKFYFDRKHPHECRIISDRSKISIRKKTGLTAEDVNVLKNIVNKIDDLIKNSNLSISEIENVLKIKQLESIVEKLQPHSSQCDEIVLFLVKHITEMEYWASQTYENMNICFSIGIDLEINSQGPNISKLYHDDMLKVLTSGIDTLIVCDKNGNIDSFIANTNDFYDSKVLSKENNSVHVFHWIQKWSKDRIAIILTIRGDILIFANNELKFVKRRSRWHLIKMSDLLHWMPETQKYDRDLKSAIAETCLDTSFRRTGACIGIITNKDDVKYLVDDDDLISNSNKQRIHFFKKVIDDKKFQDIPRAIRQELAAIDGAIVLGKDGTIFAIGAILKISHTPNGNRTTGGRSVAAQQLACYGIGIKISADGGITAWRNTKIPSTGCPWTKEDNISCTELCGFEPSSFSRSAALARYTLLVRLAFYSVASKTPDRAHT